MGFYVRIFRLGPVGYYWRPKKRRKAKPKTKAITYSATLRFDNGTEAYCGHNHRTPEAAQRCGEKYQRAQVTS